MGKNHRHKKQLKSEKAKVKLKAKKLPKGGNVTNTDFKVKKIVVREQLKPENANELMSKRKLNVKDLITRLQHFNTTARNDALNGLKELLSIHSATILTQNLHEILDKVAKLVLDQERSVRRESFKVLTMVLSPVAQIKIAPFFEVLVSYLCCAMTHINPLIQEDSLIFMDILLQSFPNLMAKYSPKILPSFLDLISKLKTDSSVTRQLTVKLTGQQTSVKWRIQVLQRLHDMLKAIVQHRTHNFKQVALGNQTKEYQKSHDKCYPIHQSNLVLNCTLSSILNPSSFADKDEEKILTNYANSLMPLLFDSWLEIKPNGNKKDSIISEETAGILMSILNIVLLICNLVNVYEMEYERKEIKQQFQKQFAKDFSKFFITSFPYAQIDNSYRHHNGGNESGNDPTCKLQNLTLVYLYLIFHSCVGQGRVLLDFDEKIFAFLKPCVMKWNKNQSDECNEVLGMILRQLFSVKCNRVTRHFVLTILKAVIDCYNNHTFSDTFSSTVIFPILSDIVSNDELKSSIVFKSWLETLPKLLCDKAVTMNVLDVTAKLCRQNNVTVLYGVRKNMTEILDNLEIMQANLYGMRREEQPKEIMDKILYYTHPSDTMDHAANTSENF